MKKIIFVFTFAVLFCFGTNNLNAQAFDKGSMVLNLGLGLGGNLAVGAGPLASFEVGLFETGDFGIIGIGIVSGYIFSTDVLLINDVNYTEFSIGPRGVYHFSIIPVENLDVYAAMDLLYVSQTTKYNNGVLPNNNGDTFYFGVVAGARYYMSDFFGFFAEVGYSITYLSGGIALKF